MSKIWQSLQEVYAATDKEITGYLIEQPEGYQPDLVKEHGRIISFMGLEHCMTFIYRKTPICSRIGPLFKEGKGHFKLYSHWKGAPLPADVRDLLIANDYIEVEE
jgi:hypothetical protein